MAHLYLPVDHTETDLVLAGRLAELIDSSELYVAWTSEQGRAVPELVAELRTPATRPAGVLAQLRQAARELWAALFVREPERQALPPAPAREPAA
jgi:hypothetical protein